MLAPRHAVAGDAAPAGDAVARCEDALRTRRSITEIIPACADLYSKPGCRAARLATSSLESYAVRVLEACARDYCPVLPESRPAACAALAPDRIRVSSAEEVIALLRELQPAILVLEHGREVQARLALALSGSPHVREMRAVAIDAPGDRLRVEIRTSGVSFIAGRTPVGPGCVLGQPGITFPGDADSKDDVPAMRRCAERLRHVVPALAGARAPDVRTDAEVYIRRVKAVLSALGKNGDEPPLFPDLTLDRIR